MEPLSYVCPQCVCLAEKADSGASVNTNPPSSELVVLGPAPAAPPPSLAMVSRQMGDSKPPQAIVKPQILTHIIEGFVIQEGAEPFPVGMVHCRGLCGGFHDCVTRFFYKQKAQNCLIKDASEVLFS